MREAALETEQPALALPGGGHAAAAHRSLMASSATPARDALHRRFADRMVMRGDLSRRVVSYQANKVAPGLRWVKYKEGFSTELVRTALAAADGPVLDPFAGIGTTPLVAAGSGRRATGIEIMPVGARVAEAIAWVARQPAPDAIKRAGRRLLAAVAGTEDPPAEARFPHVPITSRAFSSATEDAIARARAFLSRCETTACVCCWTSPA